MSHVKEASGAGGRMRWLWSGKKHLVAAGTSAARGGRLRITAGWGDGRGQGGLARCARPSHSQHLCMAEPIGTASSWEEERSAIASRPSSRLARSAQKRQRSCSVKPAAWHLCCGHCLPRPGGKPDNCMNGLPHSGGTSKNCYSRTPDHFNCSLGWAWVVTSEHLSWNTLVGAPQSDHLGTP